jgi:imidazolonepropionase-like amidohydrolase
MKNALLLLAAAGALALAGADDSFVIRNVTVHPVSGAKVENVSLLVIDGKIAEIAAKLTTKHKARVIEGKGLHVYPGMIDSATVVGIAEIASVRETVDTGELGDFNPQLRALIAVNPESDHIPVTRANGITTVMVLPGSPSGGGSSSPGVGGSGGGIIAGQAALMHLNGWTWEEMEIRRGGALQLRFPAISVRSFDLTTMALRRASYAETKRNHDLQIQKLNEFFEQARRYRTARQAAGSTAKLDLKFEAMIPVLEGKLPVLAMAAREREIREALEFAEKQQIRLVLAGVRRPGATLETIAKRKIPVILGNPQDLPLEEDDPYDESFSLPAVLHKAGVKFAFASFGAQFARNLPYEAAQAVAFGLPYEIALKSVTLHPAEIWGVEDQVGSVQVGRWADLMVTDGDPLEIPTQLKMLFVKGEAVDLETKHTRLYKKYLARP